MSENVPPVPGPRPYFVPAGIDFDALPKAVQTAFELIVEPVYCELVLGAKTSLELAAATSVVFLLAEEVLDQVALGLTMDFNKAPDPARAKDRDHQLRQHLKLVGAKQSAANFLLKIRTLRTKHGALGMPSTLT